VGRKWGVGLYVVDDQGACPPKKRLHLKWQTGSSRKQPRPFEDDKKKRWPRSVTVNISGSRETRKGADSVRYKNRKGPGGRIRGTREGTSAAGIRDHGGC